MTNAEIYKWFGILALVTSWAAIILVLTRGGSDRTLSISHHAAKHKKGFFTMAILQSIACISFILFGVKWLAPTLELPIAFSVSFVAISVGLLIAAWVPTVEGIKRKIHNITAYGATVLLLPTILLVATSPNVSVVGKVAAYTAAASMTIIFTILLTAKKAKAGYLYLQVAYWLAFDIGLFTAAFS